jgi:hypothetical protein
MAVFGQIVIGPPGSGKSTYCRAMQEFMTGIGRKVAVINLDPANERFTYNCAIDIAELVTLSDVMDYLHLGPNGGLVYCMEYLEKNVDWLEQQLQSPQLKDHYVLFDCPGQVELYTHNCAVRGIFARLTRVGYRLAAVHLADAHYCADPSKFVSVLLTSLTAMLQVEQPHVNVLSKVDLIEKYGKLPFNLDFFTEVLDLSYLLQQFPEDDPFTMKYKKLNEALVGVIEDYSLVSFVPLHIEDKESMLRVMKAVDQANGYTYGTNETDRSLSAMLCSSVAAEFECDKIGKIQEKFINSETAPDEEAVLDLDI